ncbi:MAG TPA: xanthine dehydrogenase family protein subunit M [Holophaga sp.]|nr:xanthine dehydrogenase family protein subunit M [Holophaga sp.]
MRGYLPDYDVEMPGTLGEALDLLRREPGKWRPLAGGTDLMVVFGGGGLRSLNLLDLSRIKELRGIQETDGAIAFGSLTTFTEVQECRSVHRFLPNLVKSARSTGALAIQNRGTLGGNIANASPAADTPPSLLAYGAEVDVVSLEGTRRIPYERFHLGYKKMDMAADELLLRIVVPKPSGRTFHFFRKVGTRQSLAITKVSLSAFARIEDGCVAGIRLGLGSVAATPVRARNAEAAVLGRPLADLPVREAQRALMDDINPIDDIRSTGHYRRITALKILGQMLGELAGAV